MSACSLHVQSLIPEYTETTKLKKHIFWITKNEISINATYRFRYFKKYVKFIDKISNIEQGHYEINPLKSAFTLKPITLVANAN